jgi:hypothetical protein
VPGLTPVRLDFEGKATSHPKKYLTTIEKGRNYDLNVSGRFGDQKAEAYTKGSFLFLFAMPKHAVCARHLHQIKTFLLSMYLTKSIYSSSIHWP